MPVDQFIGLGGFALIAAAIGTLLLPVGVCSECPHCQQIRRSDDAQQRRLQDEYARRWGIERPEDDD
jgi:hypothetical protein